MPPCEHCLLEVPESEGVRGSGGHLFCCQGCRAVYEFIRGEGLDTFYRRRNWAGGEQARAVPTAKVDAADFAELVSEHKGLRQIDLYLDGIRCASCVWLVEKVLGRTEGVSYGRVNYGTHQARIRWDPEVTTLERIIRRICATGYVPKPYSESERVLARRAESRDLLVRFGTAAFLSSQLMLYSVALYAGYFQGMEPGTRRAFEVIALFLTAPVLLYAGWPFFAGTLAGLRRLHFTMDSLIVLGSGSAFCYSVYAMTRGGEVYFDTAAMIVTLILLGRTLESHAKGKASESLERLLGLAPRRAVLVGMGEGGTIVSRRSVEASSLGAGDLVEVKPGEKYAADGLVVRGESTADESLLTGESRPVPKGPGATVIGGALNGYGTMVYKVTGAGGDTVLARIVASVEEALASRPPIQGIADRVVGYFVPAVLAVAAVTAATYLLLGAGTGRALLTAISVLVIACPCSLGLATPLAILVYTGRASAEGILIKGGEAAEHASAVERVVFDKTGTVTRGAVTLRGIETVDADLERRYCLEVAASLEAHSEHALGAAIVEAAAGRAPFDVTAFRAHPGRGISGSVDGRQVLIGSRRYMEESGIPVPPESHGADGGETRVFLGWEGRVRAVFVLSDGLRAEARDAVCALQAAGVQVSLVSGDGDEATSSVAARAGITDFEAGARPERKRQIVAELQAQGQKVLMVGDGINDAPALTEALVGMAVGRGTDIAMESADAVLVRSDLRLVPWFIALSRGTFRIIRQNIFWAFFYNVIAIPLAMAGALHPIVAAAAMAASSLFVVLNSLRIRSYGRSGG